MMHGPEESDSVIAVKPTNKAEKSVAEPVEPRTETKGNADQQSTRRAQDRGSVSQALERIRQVAKQRKQEKFTSLWKPISRCPSTRCEYLWICKREMKMPKETHAKAAEHHEAAAKAHRTAAEHHAKGEHAKGYEHSEKAQTHAKTAHDESAMAHTKSSAYKK
jgi:hypothetical protein